MKKLVLLSGAAALVVTAGTAQAADFNVFDEPVKKSRTWSGGYIGGHAGWLDGGLEDGMVCDTDGFNDDIPIGWAIAPPAFTATSEDGRLSRNGSDLCFGPPFVVGSLADDIVTDAALLDSVPIDAPDGLDGFVIGGQVGIRKQFNFGDSHGLVIGAEVAYSHGISVQDQIGGSIDPDLDDDDEFFWNGIFELESLSTATVTLGYGTEHVLLYGEVGGAIGHVSYSNSFGFAESDWAHGLAYGAGVEVKVTKRASAFFEWNRVHLDEVQMIGIVTGPFDGGDLVTAPMYVDVDMTADVFKGGFNILLGGGH